MAAVSAAGRSGVSEAALMRGALWALALLALAAACNALYLPGVAPLDFARDDLVYFKARFQEAAIPAAYPLTRQGR